MEYKGLEVNYVSNFTDVDDKIIKAAKEEGIDASTISERYILECKKDMASLNIKEATVHPKATEEIDSMLAIIQDLMDKDYAYKAQDGTVYFRVKKFQDYGKLSHKKLDDLEAGHREMKVTGDDKEDSFDFVLWKPKKEGEPFWHSPWCDGRPGWHIECSAMSRKYLGEEIDIHAGGEDLIFPHHENEIAQSEGANGKTFAKYWMHNGFLNIDNKKMSKSLGNFFTVRDVNQKYDPQVLRFFMLSAHYRSPLNFSEDLMEAAKNGLSRIVSSVENLRYLSEITVKWEMSEDEKKLMDEVKRFRLKFEEAMDDDFNTADAVSVIFELVKFINIHTSKENSRQCIDELVNEMEELTQILGIITKREKELLDQDIEDLINERQVARKEKNFQRADEIREELSKKGILLEDTREGVKWKRID
jgi:cysteinyl-tRNA synthetase